MSDYSKGKWERHNAPNGEHIWCGNKHIADIVTDTDNPKWDDNVNEIAKSAILMHNNPKCKAGPELYEALTGLLRITKGLSSWCRRHHNLCYGIDIEPHPDCELCKLIAQERVAGQVIAKVEGR